MNDLTEAIEAAVSFAADAATAEDKISIASHYAYGRTIVLHGSTAAVTAAVAAAEAIIRVDERAKVSEEIARAIEVKQGRRCPQCGGKAAGSKPNGYFIGKRCGAGHTWTSHEHWNAHDWAAIARQEGNRA